MLGMHARRALEEHERSQRLVIRRCLVEAGVIRIGHRHPWGAFPKSHPNERESRSAIENPKDEKAEAIASEPDFSRVS